MKNYYRIMLGEKSAFSDEAFKGNFIAGGFIKDKDLTHHLPDNWRDFNQEFIPIFLQQNPKKTKISAGLACGMLWTIAKGIQIGDVVLCPDGKGSYYAGEVIGSYEYFKGHALPHRRPVRWFSRTITRLEMSDALKRSTGSIGTVSNVGKHAAEIDSLLSGHSPQVIVSNDETVEDPSVFALEKHLEDFLVQNWKSTELGKRYDIYEEDGEIAGQQYPSDTGPIDILAISKDKKELLVVELKKGRISDVVVGQVQRYMGYVKEELAEAGQTVRGVIIAFEDDNKIRRALSVTQNIDFYTYKIQFKLEKK
jgi:restriction system protein